MPSEHTIELRHTLAFRLTLWYAGVSAVIVFLTISLFYILATNMIRDQIDEDLLNQMIKFSSLITTQGVDAGNASPSSNPRREVSKRSFSGSFAVTVAPFYHQIWSTGRTSRSIPGSCNA